MNGSWVPTKLSEILEPVSRSEPLHPKREYRLLGVRLGGAGPFHRETKLGVQMSAATVSQVKAGDFIYSRLFAWRGAFGIISSDFDSYYVSDEFPTFVGRTSRIDLRFLNLWFRLPTTIAKVEADCSGSTPLTRNRFKEHFFLSLEIPLPPIHQQRRIVARIDELTAKIDVANGLRREAIEEGEQLEAAATEQHFRDLLNNGTPSFPFEEVCERITVGHVSSMRHAYRDAGIPFLRSQNIRKNRFEPEGLCFIAPEFHEANPKSALRPGDVCIVRTGFVGVACVMPEGVGEANCADLVIVTPGALLDADYASHFLNSISGRQRAASASVGSAQKHYNVGALRKTRIPLPSIQGQRRIVARLDEMQGKVAALKRSQMETAMGLDRLLLSLLNEALSGQF